MKLSEEQIDLICRVIRNDISAYVKANAERYELFLRKEELRKSSKKGVQNEP